MRQPSAVGAGGAQAYGQPCRQSRYLEPADYRTALRGYLTTSPDLDRWRGRRYATVEDRMADHAQLAIRLHDEGWSRQGWPTLVGGFGGDVRHRAVLFDELAAHGLPVPSHYCTLETIGEPLIRFAPAVAGDLLGRFIAGTEWWGQGFSESEAGSDLASLRCRAVRDGDRYLVNGHKLWMTHGATATRFLCLVRTGTPESRHRGLTMLLIDADTPGVLVRPVALASGRTEVAEIFFDDVVVPASRLVAEQDGGWAMAMYLVQFERATYAWLVSAELLAKLRVLRERCTADADGAAGVFARAFLDVSALRCRSVDTVRRLARGETVGPESSVDKILLATAEQSVLNAARDLLWPALELGGEDLDDWRADWWYSRAATIFGGAAEIQRTILADRVLGLPVEKA